MTASIFGVSFLTPLDGLFVLVAAVPLAALLALGVVLVVLLAGNERWNGRFATAGAT